MQRYVPITWFLLIVTSFVGVAMADGEWSPPVGSSRPIYVRDIKKLDSSATVQSVADKFGAPVASIVPVPSLCYDSADRPGDVYVFEFEWIEVGKLWPKGRLGLVSVYAKGSDQPKEIVWFSSDPSVRPGPPVDEKKK